MQRFSRIWAGGLLALAAMLSTTAAPARSVDLVITGVNVIDVATGNIIPDRAIVISGDTIVEIRPTGDLSGIEAGRVVDHSGQYAMPGLWDMHIHLRGPGLVAENEAFLGQFLGHGITGVRDAAGDLAGAVAAWRREIAAGERLGPVIFTSLRKLDGKNAVWPGSIAIETVADIAPALDTLTGAGADFIKIYDSRLDPDLYLAILRQAEARGLRTSAHLPFAVAFEDALDAGLDNIEHALYLHKAASIRDREISAELKAARQTGRNTGFGTVFSALLDSFDRDRAMRIFAKMKARGMSVTPTLYVDRLLRFLDQDDHLGDPGLKQIPAAVIETYRRRVQAAARRTPQAIERDHRRMNATLGLMPLIREAGVMVLAGSDSGAFNSYVYPGDSLHRELALMVAAGFTPLDALRAATINGARWLAVDKRYGTLAAGKAADILILEANPLDDISNTRRAAALVTAGRYLDSDRLKSLRTLDPDD